MSAPLTKDQIFFLLARRLKELCQVAAAVNDDRLRPVAVHMCAAADALIAIGDDRKDGR